jgi:nucleolar protein 15
MDSSSVDDIVGGNSLIELQLDAETRDKLETQLKMAKRKSAVDVAKGVVYLAHLPYGFFETQLRGFFAQFGEVSRIRLSRSKRSGRSKGYAWVEFEEPEVAKIVAETMNNYLMFAVPHDPPVTIS